MPFFVVKHETGTQKGLLISIVFFRPLKNNNKKSIIMINHRSENYDPDWAHQFAHRTTPNDTERHPTTPNDTEQHRTTPNDTERHRTTPNDSASSKQQQAASSKQQAASSKQQAASSKQQATSIKHQAASNNQQAMDKQQISLKKARWRNLRQQLDRTKQNPPTLGVSKEIQEV